MPQKPDLIQQAEALALQRERLRQLGAEPYGDPGEIGWANCWELPGGSIVRERDALEWLAQREGNKS